MPGVVEQKLHTLLPVACLSHAVAQGREGCRKQRPIGLFEQHAVVTQDPTELAHDAREGAGVTERVAQQGALLPALVGTDRKHEPTGLGRRSLCGLELCRNKRGQGKIETKHATGLPDNGSLHGFTLRSSSEYCSWFDGDGKGATRAAARSFASCCAAASTPATPMGSSATTITKRSYSGASSSA